MSDGATAALPLAARMRALPEWAGLDRSALTPAEWADLDRLLARLREAGPDGDDVSRFVALWKRVCAAREGAEA